MTHVSLYRASLDVKGGFVDWGDSRHVLCAEGAEEIEVGNWYVEFFGNLVKWVAR